MELVLAAVTSVEGQKVPACCSAVRYPGWVGSTSKVHHSEWHFESFCMPADGINSNTSETNIIKIMARDRLQLITFAIQPCS